MVIVGDSTKLGTQPASAECVEAVQHGRIFGYPMIEVRVRTFRHLRVTPGSTVQAGTTLAVAPVGSCPGGTMDALVTLEPGPDDGNLLKAPIGPGAVGAFTIDSAGNWSGEISVPEQTTPGSYVLVAICVYSRAFTAFYPTVPITVSGGPTATLTPTE